VREMFSSAKHGSHGFVRSLDSSYPSLMASAVGADRFWQIDLSCHESEIYEKGPSAIGRRPFLFLVLVFRKAIISPPFSLCLLKSAAQNCLQVI